MILIQHNIIQFIVSFILFHSFIVTVIPPFPYLPLTISTAPSFLYCGEYFPLRIALKCMREQVNDITVNIKLIKGEKKEDVWTYNGYSFFLFFHYLVRSLVIVYLLLSSFKIVRIQRVS